MVILLLATGIYFSAAKRVFRAENVDDGPPPPPPEPVEGMLGSARGPEIIVPEISSDFETVGVVFYGRRSRVEILDCYLKVFRNRDMSLKGEY